MESEMYTLKGAAMAFEVSMNKLREAGIEVPPICELTPPSSERLSTASSACDILSPTMSHEIHHQSHRSNSICDEEMREHEEFASTNDRFEHKPDPITFTDAVLIPCAEVWDRLHSHERIDELDLAKLCSEVKKRAKCSGSGPVIEERELMLIVNQQLGEGA
ncbi:hypothetical protein BJV82DRAFT_627784 [Fennellomyces sp. T-0311]|nr:hypothetical protein BJV82DRAFT_627784 [Fennellomyces sp. T-0311]